MPSGAKRSQPLVPMKLVGRSGERNSIFSRFTRAAKKAGFRLIQSEPHRSFGHDLVGETWELTL